MAWWLWLPLVLTLLLTLILCSDIKLHLHYSRVQENDRFYLGFAVLYGIIRLRLEVPVMKFKGLFNGILVISEQIHDSKADLLSASQERLTSEKAIRFYEKARDFLRHTLGMKDWVRETISHFRCTELKWDTRIGIGGAAETAVATGVIWSLKSSLLGFLFRFVQLDGQPRVQVIPQYNQRHFSMELSCVGKIRVAAALVAAFMLLVRIARAKDGFRAWYNLLFKTLKPS